MARLSACFLLSLLSVLAPATALPADSTLSNNQNNDNITLSSSGANSTLQVGSNSTTYSTTTSLGEPLDHEANIRVRPILTAEGPPPVRMQRGQSAYALLVCASKTWRMLHSRQLPIDSILRDDWFPQNVSFHLYSTRAAATSQVGGWSCIMTLRYLLDTVRSHRGGAYWDVPTMHIFYGIETDAFGRLTLDSDNLPRQLRATNDTDSLAELPEDVPVQNFPGTVQPVRRFARRDDGQNTTLGADAEIQMQDYIEDTPGLDEPAETDPVLPPARPVAETEMSFSQKFNLQQMSPHGVIQLLLDYLIDVPWREHPNDALRETVRAGDVWDKSSVGLGQRLEVTILQLDSRTSTVYWKDVGEFVKRLLIEPTIRNQWRGWTAEVKYRGHPEPWMRVRAYVGRPGGLGASGNGTDGQNEIASS